MFEDLGGTENINHRRARRVGFELPVRCKHGVTRSTVMLKDMTTHGACIQGIPRQRIGDTVILFLPQLAPKLAFVVWSQDKTSGVEFELPLHENVFADLVADFAIGHLQRLETGRPEVDAAAKHGPAVPPTRHAA